jgi:hypothetical protein
MKIGMSRATSAETPKPWVSGPRKANFPEGVPATDKGTGYIVAYEYISDKNFNRMNKGL